MPRVLSFERSAELRKRAHALIPAGCHTYSKGDDQFPQLSPGFIERGEGCLVWDVDGNRFIDWGMGLRSVVLGHCHPRVLSAVMEQLRKGSNFTRPAPIELELAQELVDLIPCAEMVKFAKNGSDVTSAAVRLARAYTGRDLVAICKENPFFSFYDWFIGSTPCNAGIPEDVQRLTVAFHYNDVDSLRALFETYPGRIAAVILEPASTEPPQPGFLEAVRALSRREGAVLIFDEMICGFRWHLSGAQAYYGVAPDLATFGKALGNGFSVAALVGKREIMRLGGLDHDRERVFLLSATHGGETHSLAAALATIAELRERDGIGQVWRAGAALSAGINELAREAGLEAYIQARGYPCSPWLDVRDRDGKPCAELRTLLHQELIARGVLMPYIAPSLAHGDEHVEATLHAFREALAVCGRALETGEFGQYLVGPATKPVFRRYN